MKKGYGLIAVFLFFAMLTSCIPEGRDYGKELYEDKCANCHGIEGDGLQQLYPPLKGSDYLNENQDKLACIIRFGSEGGSVVNGVTFENKMEGQALLSEVDVHNIINYISKNINHNVKSVNIKEVNEMLANCKK